MTAYIVSTLRIFDQERFDAYQAAIRGKIGLFGGEVLVRGTVTEILEGDYDPGDLVVVARFPSADAAKNYISSQYYQAGRAERIDTTNIIMRLVIPQTS